MYRDIAYPVDLSNRFESGCTKKNVQTPVQKREVDSLVDREGQGLEKQGGQSEKHPVCYTTVGVEEREIERG